MEKSKPSHNKTFFVRGAISIDSFTNMLTHHQQKHEIGAHDIFIGQVRADVKDGASVKYIDYTAYEDMANKVYQQLHESIVSKYNLTCLNILHSLGQVNSGEWSLLVFASAPHRQACFDACHEMVERIKSDLPVWGKEVFENDMTKWKENT